MQKYCSLYLNNILLYHKIVLQIKRNYRFRFTKFFVKSAERLFFVGGFGVPFASGCCFTNFLKRAIMRSFPWGNRILSRYSATVIPLDAAALCTVFKNFSFGRLSFTPYCFMSLSSSDSRAIKSCFAHGFSFAACFL